MCGRRTRHARIDAIPIASMPYTHRLMHEPSGKPVFTFRIMLYYLSQIRTVPGERHVASPDLAPADAGRHGRRRRGWIDRISGPRRGQLEEIFRHHARGRSSPRDRAATICKNTSRNSPSSPASRSNRSRSRSSSSARKCVIELVLGQAELRRRPPQLSRAEAAVRERRLARRHVGLPEGPDADRCRIWSRATSRPPACNTARNDKGQMLSLPWSVDYFILYYNKELFQKKGVAVPRRLDEMVGRRREADRHRRKASTASSGAACATPTWRCGPTSILNYGGEFLDAKGNILTDGPEAIEATKLYQTPADRRSRLPASPASTGWSRWPRSRKDASAMWIDGAGWAPPLEDPTASRVVGKVGYTVVPAGPKDNSRRPMATASASPRRARTRKPPICSASGWSRSSRARGCCRPAAACRSATRSSNDAEVQSGVKMPRSGCNR